MLFKRRKPLPTHRKLGEIVWPSSGWRRAATYFGHRVGRLPGTPYKIAAGLACGVAISFTPLIGLHFLGACLIALMIRGNLIASAVGTVAGNPWTFPLIWLWTFKSGRWLLNIVGVEVPPALHFDFTLTYIVDNFTSIFIPMLVGGIPAACVAWVVTYLVAFRLVKSYQATRHRRLRKKVYRRQKLENRQEQAMSKGIRTREGEERR